MAIPLTAEPVEGGVSLEIPHEGLLRVHLEGVHPNCWRCGRCQGTVGSAWTGSRRIALELILPPPADDVARCAARRVTGATALIEVTPGPLQLSGEVITSVALLPSGE